MHEPRSYAAPHLLRNPFDTCGFRDRARSVGAQLHNVTLLLDVSMRDAVQTQLDKRRTVAAHSPTR
jgi:hypothetical protein